MTFGDDFDNIGYICFVLSQRSKNARFFQDLWKGYSLLPGHGPGAIYLGADHEICVGADLGFDRLRSINPGVVACRIGYGLTPPDKQDLLTSVEGALDHNPGFAFADACIGLVAAEFFLVSSGTDSLTQTLTPYPSFYGRVFYIKIC